MKEYGVFNVNVNVIALCNAYESEQSPINIAIKTTQTEVSNMGVCKTL